MLHCAPERVHGTHVHFVPDWHIRWASGADNHRAPDSSDGRYSFFRHFDEHWSVDVLDAVWPPRWRLEERRLHFYIAEGLPTLALFVGRKPAGIDANPDFSIVRGRTFWTGTTDYTEVPNGPRCVDICWTAHRFDYDSPLKQFDYVSMALPALVAGNGQPSVLVEDRRVGLRNRMPAP